MFHFINTEIMNVHFFIVENVHIDLQTQQQYCINIHFTYDKSFIIVWSNYWIFD